MTLLNSKLGVVRFIRAFFDFGLSDCDAIARVWEKTYDNNFCTADIHEIMKLGSICKMIKSGEWVIEHGCIFLTKKLVDTDDVARLNP